METKIIKSLFFVNKGKLESFIFSKQYIQNVVWYYCMVLSVAGLHSPFKWQIN